MKDLAQCVLCGNESPAVSMALIRWSERDEKKPTHPRPFGYGPRCDDRAACLERQREPVR